MKTMIRCAAVLFLVGLGAFLAACFDSANATNGTADTYTKAEVDALIENLKEQLGPRIIGGQKSEHARIGQYSEIAWDGPDCTGNAFLHRLGPTGARQGFVFMLRDAADTTGEASPYFMVGPGTERESFTWVSTTVGTGCANQAPLAFEGYRMVENSEAVCGVPDFGIPAQMFPQDDEDGPLYEATMHSVLTGAGCSTIVPADVLPVITVGAG